jgi:hypothetical protein
MSILECVSRGFALGLNQGRIRLHYAGPSAVDMVTASAFAGL